MRAISSLSLSKEIINKLKDKEINYIEDVWVLKRIDLKNMGCQ